MNLKEFFDQNNYLLPILFGSVAWGVLSQIIDLIKARLKKETALLKYRKYGKVYLSTGHSRLQSTWDGIKIDNLQMIVFVFWNGGNSIIENKELILWSSDGEILDVVLLPPENEKWEATKEADRYKLPIQLLKKGEEFRVAVYAQNASEDSILVESRSELKISKSDIAASVGGFTTHRAGFMHGWTYASCGPIGAFMLEIMRKIETTSPFPDKSMQASIVIIGRVVGYAAMGLALIGVLLNVVLDDWPFHNSKHKKS